MAKLSDNQAAAVAALSALLTETGAEVADKNAWKKAVPDGVSVNTNSLVKAKAVVATKAVVGSRQIEVFAPVRATAEVGG